MGVELRQLRCLVAIVEEGTFTDAAIALGLSRVEAGAQGGHKLARGYEPVRTVSAHYIVHQGLRTAIADYLEQERAGIAGDQLLLDERTPFRKL